MPTVKADIENRVNLRPITDAKTRAADFGSAGEMVARGGAALGGALQDGANTMMQIEAVHDEAAVSKMSALALADLRRARTDATMAEGLDATAARNAFGSRSEEIRREYSGKLSSPRQRAMFEELYTVRSADDLAMVDEHEVKQVRVAQVAGFKAVGEESFNRAVEAQLEGRIDVADREFAGAELMLRRAAPGRTEEEYQASRNALKSNLHTSVAEALIVDDAVGAAAYVDKFAGEIDPEQERKLRAAIQPRFEEEEEDAGLAFAISGGPVPAAAKPTEVIGAEEVPAPAAAQKTKYAEASQPSRKGYTSLLGDPLRGAGKAPGRYNEVRSKKGGGVRHHNGVDHPAPVGTPVRPPAEGRVLKVWNDTKHGGGLSVLVDHGNGRTTGYAHLSRQNVKPGDKITPETVLGLVGNTGVSTGPHLHYTVTENGVKGDPTKVIWNGVATRAPVGSLALPTMKYKEVTADEMRAALDRADAFADARGLSPRRQQALRGRVLSHFSTEDRIAKQAQDEAYSSAVLEIAKADVGGAPVTSVSQVPGFALMGANQQARVLEIVGSNRKAAERPPENSETYYKLLNMSYDPAQKTAWKSLDLGKFAGAITPAELARLQTEQIKNRNGVGEAGGKGPGPISHGAVSAAVNRLAPSLGIGTTKKDKARRDTVYGRTLQLAQTWREKYPDKVLTDDVLADMVNMTVADVWVADESGRLTQTTLDKLPLGAKVGFAVPDRDRAQIRAAWREAHPGQPDPTPEQMYLMYVNRPR